MGQMNYVVLEIHTMLGVHQTRVVGIYDTKEKAEKSIGNKKIRHGKFQIVEKVLNSPFPDLPEYHEENWN